LVLDRANPEISGFNRCPSMARDPYPAFKVTPLSIRVELHSGL
jgi:hypothetical protein